MRTQQGEGCVRRDTEPCCGSTLRLLDEHPGVLRLRYQGSADRWAIGIYRASTGQYSESGLPGSFGPVTGTPEQGIDGTFILYAGPGTGG
jgi:hypothetical protein